MYLSICLSIYLSTYLINYLICIQFASLFAMNTDFRLHVASQNRSSKRSQIEGIG